MPRLAAVSPVDAELKRQTQAGERAAIQSALTEHGYRMAETAASLGISRKTLWQKIKRYGIARPGAEA